MFSTFCKLYTNILNKRLISYLDSNNIIEDEQTRIRKDRSREDHIYTLTALSRNRKTSNLSTFACFVDMAKAFDRVNRDILLIKLANIGILGNLLDSIKKLYAEYTASVNVNDCRRKTSLSPPSHSLLTVPRRWF